MGRVLRGFVVPIIAIGALTVVGCAQESEREQTAFCTEVAKAAHPGSTEFAVNETSIERTSEGAMVRLAVAYRDATGSFVQGENRCWFRGTEPTSISEFYIDTRGGGTRKINENELTGLITAATG